MKIFYAIWVTILGAIIGSFLGCMGYRIPNKIKTTYPSSFCSNCKKPLKWFMNIPIISYILLRGRCYYCKKKYGFIYFLCEILGALLFLLNYLLYDFTLNFFISTILVCMLLVTIVSDFLYYYISDRVLIISGFLLLIAKYIFLGLNDTLMYLLSGVCMFVIMYAIKMCGNIIFRKESLGDGDIKLMGVLGISIGLFNSFIALFLASIIALIYSLITMKRNRENLVPYGPFLILGALLVVYLSNTLVTYITELFTF